MISCSMINAASTSCHQSIGKLTGDIIVVCPCPLKSIVDPSNAKNASFRYLKGARSRLSWLVARLRGNLMLM